MYAHMSSFEWALFWLTKETENVERKCAKMENSNRNNPETVTTLLKNTTHNID